MFPEDGPFFCLNGYGDGSGRRTQLDVTRRCGWSVVAACLGEDGLIRRHSEAYGPLPFCYQHVHTAELFAFLFYLQHAVAHEGQYKFFSDCAYVVDQFARGRAANTHGWAVDADLWTKVFQVVDEVGADLVFLFKIRAHRKIEHGMEPLDRMQIIANNRADGLAKLGVELHPDDVGSREACVSDAGRVVQVVKFMTRCLSFAIEKGVYKDIQNEQLEYISKASSVYDPETLLQKHFFTKLFDDSISKRCVKCFAKSAGGARFGKCPGDVWLLGHRISTIGADLVFCIRCGAFSMGRVDLLLSTCHGKPTTAATRRAKARLVEGKHPITMTFIAHPKPLCRYFRPSPGIDHLIDEVPVEDIDVILE